MEYAEGELMKILFLHGWHSVPGGVKPTYLMSPGHTVINPALDDDDFDFAVQTAQAEYDQHHPNVIVGSSRGGAIAMNIDSGDTPLILLCPAWKNWGTVTSTKRKTTILHSRNDDVIPFKDSEVLAENSKLREGALIEVGNDHRLADPNSLEAMLGAAIESCIPSSTDDPEEMLQQEWAGLCYTASVRWVTRPLNSDWVLVHGKVGRESVRKRVDHAWCELDDQVVDLTMSLGNRRFDREEYYRIFEPEITKIYSSEDAMWLIIKNRHDGPWDESEQLD
ncbi:alpha/beta hydrolase [Gimesia sp.]|uniref:alpha/beta hydrolase n=1 Tax=Gimesia sp. TaxID=2024833 RepID=UPI003A8F1870